MRERNKSTLWKMLFMVLLLCTTMGIISINVTSGVPLPTIHVDPTTTTVVLGKSFTINFSIANVSYPEHGKGIYGWQCDLSFNTSILQLVSVEEGPFLKKAGNTTWAPPEIKNDTLITGCELEPPWPEWGVFGSDVLANVTFQTIDEGETPLNFTKTKLRTYVPGTGPSPVDHTVINGSATVTPGHDVAVVRVTAPDEGASGYSVPVNVTVKNEGSYPEVVNVTLRCDSAFIGSQNVALAKKENQTVSFTWNTMGVSKGNYTLNATATIDLEDDPTDNSNTTTVRIVEHDVAVIDLEAPPSAKQGWTVSINVTVANQGNFTENLINVTVSYDGNLIGFNDTVALGPQTNTTVPFSWNTASVPLSDYNLTATATIPVDDDPTDDSKNKTITIYLIHDVAVISIEAEYDPEEPHSPVGKPIPINVTVKNEGDYLEDVNVTLRYDSTYIDSDTVTLAQGVNQTVSFTWNTVGLTPTKYTVKATASLNYTDTWAGDGEEESFYTTRKPVDAGSEKVYVNETLKAKPADYTIDYGTGNITFTTAPGEGADVKAIYFARDDDYSVNNYQTKDIILTVHDVAVIGITAPSEACSNSTVPIDVTVKDEGSWRETVNLTLKYDDTLIGNKTFDVYKGLSTTVSFTWNTTDVTPATYTLTANVTVLTSPSNEEGIDDDPTNNNKTKPIEIKTGGDVAVINVIPAWNQGYPTWTVPLNITVTVLNNGTTPANFTVTAYYDTNVIGTQDVTNLAASAELNLTFSWNITGLEVGFYNETVSNYNVTVRAYLAEDVNPDNNEFVVQIKIKIPGDIDGDGKSDKFDFGDFATAFGSHEGEPRYNPDADLNADGKIDKFDFGWFATYFGEKTTY